MGTKTQTKTIALLNQKGGVGKTTLSFHLAYALNALGKNVLCLDLDPQANLTQLLEQKKPELNVESEMTPIYQLLINCVKELKSLHRPFSFSDALQSSGPLSYIPSGSQLSALELSLSSINFPKQLVFKRFLEQKKSKRTI